MRSRPQNDPDQIRAYARVIKLDYPNSAESLRIIADRLEGREAEITDRLALAGKQAAEAQHLAEDLKRQLAQDQKTAAEAKMHLTRVAGEAMRLNGELTRDLTVAKNNNQVAQRTIAFLLDKLGADDVTDEPIDVRFQFTTEPGGLTPSEASDLALGLTLDGNEIETA